jgi:hypothetical protein
MKQMWAPAAEMLTSQIRPARPCSKRRAPVRELDLWLRHPPLFVSDKLQFVADLREKLTTNKLRKNDKLKFIGQRKPL